MGWGEHGSWWTGTFIEPEKRYTKKQKSYFRILIINIILIKTLVNINSI